VFTLFPMVMIAVLLIGLAFCFLLPADFRRTFFSPATIAERLLVKSIGIVAIVALAAEVTLGHGSDNGLYGISPCVLFGTYVVMVVYGRAAWFLWKRQSQKSDLAC
jgi:hypothetical protein